MEETIAVIGAGTMGAQIALAFAQAGHTVNLADRDEATAEAGKQRIAEGLERRVAKGRLAADGILARMRPVGSVEAAVEGVAMVVEAVFEDLAIKQDLFRRLGQMCGPEVLLGTNTSSFRVRDLAAASAHPERVVGLHFFLPASVNLLVEVVQAPDTSDEAFARTWDLVEGIGKTVIRTGDAPGFAVNRFLLPWMNEACRVLAAGEVPMGTLEVAARQVFGIGMGPFALMNATGLPVDHHAVRTLFDHLGDYYEPDAELARRGDANEPWVLPTSDEEPADLTAEEALEAVWPLTAAALGVACHLVEEGVATPRDVDLGATVGLRWRRGPFALIRHLGPERVLGWVKRLNDRWGDAFPVPALLADWASGVAEVEVPAVAVERFRDVARLTLDTPHRLNALSPRLLADLEAGLTSIEGDPSVRAVILTGQGKAFAAGADVPGMMAMSQEEMTEYAAYGNRLFDRLARLRCPVVVALNGLALGGGLELALCGDILVASDKAQVGLPEVKLGLHPGWGGTQRLPRRIGVGRAKDLILTGRNVPAAEAHAMGLVDRVVPHVRLQREALELARNLTTNGPLAMAAAKCAIDDGFGLPFEDAMAVEAASLATLNASKDRAEGLAAFVERRPARFEGA
ncbi:MAG: enoyl-CoA hydratase-related protein [Thermoplasmatota archaeon]